MKRIAVLFVSIAACLAAASTAQAAGCEGHVDEYGDCVVIPTTYAPDANGVMWLVCPDGFRKTDDEETGDTVCIKHEPTKPLPCPSGRVYDPNYGAGQCVDPTPAKKWRGRYCGDVRADVARYAGVVDVRAKHINCRRALRVARAVARSGRARWHGWRATRLGDNRSELARMGECYGRYWWCDEGPPAWDYGARYRRGRATIQLDGYLADE